MNHFSIANIFLASITGVEITGCDKDARLLTFTPAQLDEFVTHIEYIKAKNERSIVIDDAKLEELINCMEDGQDGFLKKWGFKQLVQVAIDRYVNDAHQNATINAIQNALLAAYSTKPELLTTLQNVKQTTKLADEVSPFELAIAQRKARYKVSR